MTVNVDHRIFVLSPAHCGGKRAALLVNHRATFPLAVRLRESREATLGEAFSFLSGLYFRGKLTYASRFSRPPEGVSGSLVITTNRGLVPAESPVGLMDIREFGGVEIDPADARYRAPLERDLVSLAARDDLEVVLLGSIATGKYLDVLLDALGNRLLIPTELVGRGDMSRGALLLRAARDGVELDYVPVAGAARHGPRPRRIEVLE